jgi:peptidylprolyl isomerase
MRARRLTAAAITALSLAAFTGGCGSDKGGDSTSTINAEGGGGSGTEAQPAPEATTTTATAPPAAGAKGGKVVKEVPVSNAADTKSKPKIARPDGSPPPQLASKDLVVGKGKAAKSGDKLSVQYVGVSFSSGKQFDASWDNGKQPFVFPLGGGQVIPGWDQGLEGMKKGGRRELIIPPDQGYGAQGQPPDILPNETLVFVIDLESIS